MVFIILIFSIYLTIKIMKIVYSNTMGTRYAYLLRGYLIWVIVLFILSALLRRLT